MTLEHEEFRHRPDHPDFQRLSDLILALDAGTQFPTREQAARAFSETVAQHVDEASVTYLAMQRVFRLLGISTAEELAAHANEVPRLTALYMEGFLMGSSFAQTKPQEAE